jgi:ABC-2 type transport system permease protein
MTAPLSWTPGALSPRPAAASRLAMIRAQTRAQLTVTLRNGEHVLLTMIIPLGLLVALTLSDVIEVPGRPVDFFVPGVLSLAIMSSAFTGQAIATGFERQYGVLKRLGATPLSRPALLLSKTAAVLVLLVLQLLLIGGVGLLLGWEPHGNAGVLPLVVLGAAGFSGLGLLLGGTLRGLTSLASANVIWFALLLLGGVMFPLHEYGGAADLIRYLPTAALSDGLRQLLQHGDLVVRDLVTLAVWAVVSLTAAAKAFRWE